MTGSLLPNTDQAPDGGQQQPAGQPAAAPTQEGQQQQPAAPSAPLEMEHEGAKLAVPEQFIADGQLNAAALLKAYTDKEAATAVPESYAVSLDGDAAKALAAGGELDKDPVFQQFAERAKKAGMSQTQFDEVLSWAGDLVGTRAGETEAQAAEAREAEMTALKQIYGARTDETLRSLSAYTARLTADLGEGVEPALDALTSTAAGIQFLDAMRTGKIKPGVEGNLPGAAASGGGGTSPSEDDLKALMNDPKYWRDKDPATVAKVQEGFKRLYPG